MDLRVTHLNPEGLFRNPAFSQAVVVDGSVRTVYVGGQNAVVTDGSVVGIGDLAAQSEQVFQNLRTLLAASGAALHDIVKLTIYVVQGQDLLPGLGAFQRAWGSTPPPVISVAMVAGLAHPDFLIEIDAVAVTSVDERSGGEQAHGG